MKSDVIKNTDGVIGLYITIIMLVLIFGMIASISFGIFTQERIIQNITQSTQAHYAAESGAEDALLRLATGKNWSSPYSVQVQGAAAEVAIDDSTSEVRIVRVEGDLTNRIRNSEVVFEISSSVPGFNYGAQVGEGGVNMGNNAIIDGNIFSNGSVIGNNGAEVQGTVKISNANPANKLSNVDVTEDAYVETCEDNGTVIGGVLHANNPGSCNYGSLTTSGLPVDPIALPISDSQVQEWQEDAEAGGILNSDQDIIGSGNTLGPVRINGNLQVTNGAELIVTGTIWVTGNIHIDNNAHVHLASGYGSTSGTIIGGDGSGGNIQLLNGSVSEGSGSAGSYLMYVADSNADPAIHVHNNAIADIVYSNHGWITLENNADIRQITGYGFNIQNNAVVTYEIGLQDAAFTSGPGGGWTVTSWKEIE